MCQVCQSNASPVNLQAIKELNLIWATRGIYCPLMGAADV